MESGKSTKKPILIVFAGPNGSGKSTITEGYAKPSLYINADEIQKQQKPIAGESLNEANLRAAQEAERQRELAIQNRQSFSIETVLSTPRNLNLMRKAKEAGYEITLAYITTQDPNINLKRVMRRKEEGGHDVPPDKTVSRYEKSLNLLPEAFKIADKAKIYNNSFDSPVLLVEKTLDKCILLYPQKIPSKWDKQKIKELVGIENLKMKNPSDLSQTKEHIKIDKYNILQAPTIKDLPKKPDDKTLFNAYAKAVLDETGQKWTDKTNQLIVEKMLKSKEISSTQAERALKHSPEPINNVSLFVRKIENQPEIKAILRGPGGMRR